ncbi:THAP domain-containing protein 9 [Plakobranchus ocellatus]|uniref:THAP domain-containing protein 9 n=1 Tax=Plakobranchus ocellatus TaxID=259542 RepID=A0AAV4DRG7_9GAST|nr:THAP domain-containing protein 9 [Plakobranchus ocellatus]
MAIDEIRLEDDSSECRDKWTSWESALQGFLIRNGILHMAPLRISFLIRVQPDCMPAEEGQETTLNCTVNTAALACPSSTLLEWRANQTTVVIECNSNGCSGGYSLRYGFSATINNNGSTLTIPRVTRTDPINMETGWTCRPCGDSSREVTACDKLEVYDTPSDPRCRVIEIAHSPGDVEFVRVSCFTTRVYPKAKCTFKWGTNAEALLQDSFSEMSLDLFRHVRRSTKDKKPLYIPKVRNFALSLHFLSPRAYDFIRPILHLPYPRYLRKWKASVHCSPGYLENMLRVAAAKARSTESHDCSLIVDEMSLRRDISWVPSQNRYCGFTDFGQGPVGNSIASNALLFMLVSLKGRWKSPIAYFLTDHISSTQLTTCVKEAICRTADHNLTVKTLVADRLKANMKAADEFGCNSDVYNFFTHFQHPHPRHPDEKESYRYLLTYKFSQDHVEMFFGKIRQQNGWYNNPTSEQFQSSLKSLMMSSTITPSRHGNAIPLDDTVELTLTRSSEVEPSSDVLQYNIDFMTANSHIDSILMIDTDWRQSCLYYTADFAARRTERHLQCRSCSNALFDHTCSSPQSKFLQRKDSGGLKLPSKVWSTFCRQAKRHFASSCPVLH